MPITVLFICGNPEQPHPCTALRADNGASFKIKNRVVVVVVHIWQPLSQRLKLFWCYGHDALLVSGITCRHVASGHKLSCRRSRKFHQQRGLPPPRLRIFDFDPTSHIYREDVGRSLAADCRHYAKRVLNKGDRGDQKRR
jgi:hypothetical protein